MALAVVEGEGPHELVKDEEEAQVQHALAGGAPQEARLEQRLAREVQERQQAVRVVARHHVQPRGRAEDGHERQEARVPREQWPAAGQGVSPSRRAGPLRMLLRMLLRVLRWSRRHVHHGALGLVQLPQQFQQRGLYMCVCSSLWIVCLCLGLE